MELGLIIWEAILNQYFLECCCRFSFTKILDVIWTYRSCTLSSCTFYFRSTIFLLLSTELAFCMFYISCSVNSKWHKVSLRYESFLNVGGILDMSDLGFISPIPCMWHVHLKVYWQHFIDVPELRCFTSVLLKTFLLPILWLTFITL